MRMGWRLYTSDRHDFNAFLNEAYIERYPLTDLRVTDTADGAAYLGYDANRGCYTFTVNGTDFNIYYKDKQRNFRISTELEGSCIFSAEPTPGAWKMRYCFPEISTSWRCR